MTAAPGDIRIRVERLLAGETRIRDLDKLFAWLRFRSFGNTAVRDVGDFANHLEDRDRGVAWRGAQQLHVSLTAHWARLAAKAGIAPPPTDRDELAAGLRATLGIFPPSLIVRDLGMSKVKAGRALERAIGAITGYDGNRIEVRDDLRDGDRTVATYLFRHIIIEPALSSEMLINQAADALVRNGALAEDELDQFLQLECLIAVFAIEKMHLATLILNKDVNATLYAAVIDRRERAGGTLAIQAHIPLRWGDVPSGVAVSLFETRCRANDWLQGGYDESRTRGGYWTDPLEIGADGRLLLLEGGWEDAPANDA